MATLAVNTVLFFKSALQLTCTSYTSKHEKTTRVYRLMCALSQGSLLAAQIIENQPRERIPENSDALRLSKDSYGWDPSVSGRNPYPLLEVLQENSALCNSSTIMYELRISGLWLNSQEKAESETSFLLPIHLYTCILSMWNHYRCMGILYERIYAEMISWRCNGVVCIYALQGICGGLSIYHMPATCIHKCPCAIYHYPSFSWALTRSRRDRINERS